MRNKTFWAVIAVLAMVHLHDSEVFHRLLINHDDRVYIGPLENMGLWDYLTQFLPNRANYAFPLRDLSYFLDFELFRWTGLRTFLLFNVVWFAFALLFFSKCLEIVFPNRSALRGLSLAIVALHPVQGELLDWASGRKHILAGLFTLWGTWIVLRRRQGPVKHFWPKVFACYLASLLCWPTALLWILWVGYERRADLLSGRARRFGFGALGMACVLGALYFLFANNSDYLFGPSFELSKSWFYLWSGFGRAFFNLVLPIRLVP